MSLFHQVEQLKQALEQKILGQHMLTNRLLVALFANGHLLVEGAPGLAKTKSIKALGELIEGDFHRIQFTPDLLPADITGTEVFKPIDSSFTFQKGPIFHNLILADEINRAPAKVQSALLEGMEERQVSVGQKTYALPELFLVMATQNPIEQEGTFPLPEAQLDRFMMHIKIDYPSAETERRILQQNRKETLILQEHAQKPAPLLSQKDIFSVRREIMSVHMQESVENYIVELVIATRKPGSYKEALARYLDYGASPRATIHLDRCARTVAWLSQRDYVTPADVQGIAHEILRHRIGVSFEAQTNGITADHIIDEILNLVSLP